MQRRQLFGRVAAWLAVAASGFGLQAQRLAQPLTGRLEYVLSRGQDFCMLIRLDGSRVLPNQVQRVAAKLSAEHGGIEIELHAAQGDFAFEDRVLQLGSNLQRWNANDWIERIIVEHS